MEDPFRNEPEPRPRPVRRLTWLLLALLLTTAFLARTIHVPGSAVLVTEGPPPAVAATGRLAEVFERSRAAVVRIEGRCPNPLLGRMPVGIGTGFFISPGGQLLTAYHVVQQQALQGQLRCRLRYVAVDAAEREYPLELVGFDAYLDLALMQAEVPAPVPYLPLAAGAPRVGSEVVAIGNSRGEFLGDRSGRVTRLGVRAAQANFASDTIELTAALAPGDSGGPVLSERGEVVGVVSYISFSPGTLSSDDEPFVPLFLRGLTPPEYASYAVPVRTGSEVLDALQAGERRDVPVIGFEAAFDYDPRAQGRRPLGPRPGVVVGRVQRGGPAERAGLRSLEEQPLLNALGEVVGTLVAADVIVAVDGERTPSFNALLAVVRDKEIGERVDLSVQRGSETVELTLELAAYRQVFE